MLNFRAFPHQTSTATTNGAMDLRCAHALSKTHTIPSDIRYHNGLIVCERDEPGATALGVQWDTGALGALTLQTCLLPQRTAPYLLSLELARRALMLYIVKLEEWGLVELAADEPAPTAFAKARNFFYAALAQPGEIGSPNDIARATLARRALAGAIDAGEHLVRTYADRQIAKRIHAGVRTPIGCVAHQVRYATPLTKLIEQQFDFVQMPLRWSELEPEEGQYRFGPTDKWMRWAAASNVVGAAGPLVDLRHGAVPEWLSVWDGDYATIRKLIYDHVKTVVLRYKRAVRRWSAIAGVQLNHTLTLSMEQALDLTRLCAMMLRKASPEAKIQVDIEDPFGETLAQNRNAISSALYAELVCQSVVEVDALCIVVRAGDGRLGNSARPMLEIAAMLDRYGALGKPLRVRFAAPSAPGDPAGGSWRGPWNEARQAAWLTAAARTALAHPAVVGLCWEELYDAGAPVDTPYAGLISDQGVAKPALNALGELRRSLAIRPAKTSNA